jgi:hypothetical protein
MFIGFFSAVILNAYSRHCERSEAIQKPQSKNWIASSLTLLAMTAMMTLVIVRTAPDNGAMIAQ